MTVPFLRPSAAHTALIAFSFCVSLPHFSSPALAAQNAKEPQKAKETLDWKGAAQDLDRYFKEHPAYELLDGDGKILDRNAVFTQGAKSFFIKLGGSVLSAPVMIGVRTEKNGRKTVVFFSAYDIQSGFAEKTRISRAQVTIDPKNDPQNAFLQTKGAMESLTAQVIAFVGKSGANRKIASVACTEDAITFPVTGLVAISSLPAGIGIESGIGPALKGVLVGAVQALRASPSTCKSTGFTLPKAS